MSTFPLASQRKRWPGALALAAVMFCALIGACGNDDKLTAASTAASTSRSAGDSDTTAVLPVNPLSAAPAAASASVVLTIQSPAVPASGADAALSAAASEPLAPPVIHTVD
jgi:hypothetical protein